LVQPLSLSRPRPRGVRPGLRWIVPALLLAGPVAAQDAPGVLVAEATRVSFPLTVEGLGTARANESVEIRPQVAETITAIRFTEGERVEAGTILVELEDAEALADVASAKASLADSESKYQRAQELFRSELVSSAELEPLAARRDADRAAVDAAEARLADTVVRAPFAGRVGLRRVSRGSLVGPSTVITTLDDTDTMKLDFDVPETALSLLAAGLPIEAHSAAWPDSVFRGTVETVDTRVDPVSRTVTVRALVPNPEARLRPGMFLAVRLLRDEAEALVIPEHALVPEQSRQFVFVVGEADVIEKRGVKLGRRRVGEVEILEGLEAGERVVVEGTQKVRPGQTVRVLPRTDVSR
jgi:membrane fusion protein (multidrug efflux system)